MTDGQRNYYEVLGVGPDASNDDIRSAYRGLARSIHPDTPDAPADAQARMAEINEAWSVLNDERRRDSYDALLRSELRTDPVFGDSDPEDSDPEDVIVPASPVEAIVPLASATGAILTGLGFAGGAPGITFFGVVLLGIAIVAFAVRRKRL